MMKSGRRCGPSGMESLPVLIVFPVASAQRGIVCVRCNEIERSAGRLYINAQEIFANRTKDHKDNPKEQEQNNHYSAPTGHWAKKDGVEQKVQCGDKPNHRKESAEECHGSG